MTYWLFDYDSLPNIESLKRYVTEGVPVGGFLEAVISNDLKEACGRADDENIKVIPVYVSWLYNEAPSTCWGSKERYEAWLTIHHQLRERAKGASDAEPV